MKCHDCGKEIALPFKCPYCEQYFCIEHRLPENHLCPLSPKREPLGATLTHKNPYSLTKYRKRHMARPPIITGHKRNAASEFSSEGKFHFVRNPHYRQRKKIKRAIKVITSLVIIVALSYCLWINASYITQIYNDAIKTVFPTNTNDEIETQIFQLINTERANRGLPTLQNNTSLTAIAKSWCSHLAQTQSLTHGDFSSRVAASGTYTVGYEYGEIIESYGSTTGSSSNLARIFVDGWLDSEGHREIMLTASGGSMGVGVNRGGGTLYGVVDFQFVSS